MNDNSRTILVEKVNHLDHPAALATALHQESAIPNLAGKSPPNMADDRLHFGGSATMLGGYLVLPLFPKEVNPPHSIIMLNYSM